MTESDHASESPHQTSDADKERAEEVKNEANVAFKGNDRHVLRISCRD